MSRSASPSRAEAADPLLDELIAEITDKLHGGEAVDVEVYVAAHPQLAEELRRLMPALALLAAAAGPAGSMLASVDEEGKGHLQGQLGDFRILGELGRGGMGVVYRAEQVSLRRPVALKVLPQAATLDPRQLQRFRNEAQAAACLQHPHIVPVYAIGCEGGVHFYAMQLIEGLPLTAILCQQRQPRESKQVLEVEKSSGTAEVSLASTSPGASSQAAAAFRPELTTAYTPPPLPCAPLDYLSSKAHSVSSAVPSGTERDYYRWVAQLGVQAAEALDHAHQMGVVHRDIKPGNLLLDAKGQVWVTDFGLAQVRQQEGGLTQTGDIVGTIRYMSPEQALAQRDVLDQRSDVYSLGATLYEMLTLQAAFTSTDRQELLRQVVSEEPSRPRQLRRSIPVDVETIVLKAMEKRPQDRYATAKELADDLQRFLDDQPIRARRPTFVQWGRKWALRHQSLVAAAMVVFLVAMAALAIITGLVWQQKGELRSAFDREAEQRQRAEIRLQMAWQAADDMYTDVAQEWLTQQPRLEPVQRKFLCKALVVYQELAREKNDNPDFQLKIAQAHHRVGQIEEQLGDYPAAEEAYRHSLDILEPLVADNLSAQQYRPALCATYLSFAQYFLKLDRFREAEALCLRAVSEASHLVEDAPDGAKHRHFLAKAQSILSTVLSANGKPGESKRASQEARRHLERLIEKSSSPEHMRDLGAVLHNLATDHKEPGEARQLYEEAIRYQQAALQKMPRDYQARIFLRNHYTALAETLSALGKGRQAEDAFRKAIQLAEGLLDDYPNTPDMQRRAAWLWLSLGDFYRSSFTAIGREASEKAYRKAIDWLEPLTKGPAGTPADWSNLGSALCQLGDMVWADTKRQQEARDLLDRAIRCSAEALRSDRHNQVYREQIVQQSRLKGMLLLGRANHREAVKVAESLVEKLPDLLEAYVAATTLVRAAVDSVAWDPQYGEVSVDRSLPAEQREKCTRQYIKYLRELLLAAAHCAGQEKAGLTRLARIEEYLAACLVDHPCSTRDVAEAVTLAEKVAARIPHVWQVGCTLGRAYYRAGQFAQAVETLEQSSQLHGGDNPWNGYILAMAYWKLDNKEEANQLFFRSLRSNINYSPASPELASFCNEAAGLLGLNGKQVARALTLRPECSGAEVASALQMARAAVEAEADNGDSWSTLALAQYRAESWQEAEAALRRSLVFHGGGDASDFFLLAMVRYRRGEKEEARKWYDRAVARMEKYQPRNKELRLLRREAASLLAVAE